MRGTNSVLDDIRRNVFEEVARLAYEEGDRNRVDMIPCKLIQGKVAQYRHDIFLERAVVAARTRLVLGMDINPKRPRMPLSALTSGAPRIRNILKGFWSISFPFDVYKEWQDQ